ncbi:MAG: glycine cleavage system aminomethyltransferase GcvT [Alphaproteobacteria bacterium]|nr:glycine cleavage system aminomethyltransferase GcvT [Alphaproteobacteria bacterium]
MSGPSSETARHTPLYDLHRELGGRLVPFAGYAMPVQYPSGIIAEHTHCRTAAGLFDVSHMGQGTLTAAKGDPAALLERLVPGDIVGLAPGRMRYTLLLNSNGGIEDDLMATRLAADRLYLVVNAATKDADFALIARVLGAEAKLERHDDKALLALQGPAAATVMGRLSPDATKLPFLGGGFCKLGGQDVFITRSGYTGEDGFEVSVKNAAAEALARLMLAQPEVKPIGLGARDSLRLEAGLCLYGHDIDTATTPIEAGLAWTIGKRRREAADFPAAAKILGELKTGAKRKRVGLKVDGRAPAREGAKITDASGKEIGKITSGGFGPSFGGPIALGYVAAESAAPGTSLFVSVRDKPVATVVAPLPFVPTRYYRGT